MRSRAGVRGVARRAQESSAGGGTLVHGGRVVSVDALRGLAIAGMIAVNHAGPLAGTVPQFEHAGWVGFRLADLVFPAFLFAVGAAMALTEGRHSWPRVLRRAALLFAVGVALNLIRTPDLAEVRIMGVLQRIALAYLGTVVVVRLLPVAGQVAAAASLLGAHWALLALTGPPGQPRGVLTPEGSVAGWIDRTVLGTDHVYLGQPIDPEGLLGTLPAVVSVLAGYWALRWLRRSGPRFRWQAAGALAAVAVAALAAASVWEAVLPVSKPLWTASYVLLAAGWSLLLLAVLHWLVDGAPLQPAAWPLAVLGRNALVVYVGSEAVRFVGVRLPVAAVLVVWWAVAVLLDWRGWHLRL